MREWCIIIAGKSLDLVFSSVGVVEAVWVERGDVVRTGDVLAQWEIDELELAVKQARAAVEAAKANLAQVTVPPREEEVPQAKFSIESAQAGLAVAQADLDGAKARLAQVWVGVSDEDLSIAQLDVEAVRVQLSQLQIDPVISLQNVLLATGFAVAVGLFFGIYPPLAQRS